MPSAQRFKLSFLAAAALLLAPALPHAQAAPDAPLPRELGKPEDDVKLDVRAYQVDGLANASPETRAALAAATAPYTGTGRNYEDLMNAVAAVTRVMQRDLGYYVGFAYLPEQSIARQDGVIRIQALEGKLDRVKLEWPEGIPVDRAVAEGYLARLKPGEVLRERDVERVVFLVNDLQGVKARFEIEPGEAPGTATLVVTAQPEARLRGRVDVDTLGSHYTGTGRLSGQATLASPLGLGDALGVNAMRTFTGGLTLGGLNYVVPLGSDGWKIGAAVSKISYDVDDDVLPNDLHGSALATNAFVLYPVVRSRNLNLFGVLTYEHKRFDDRQTGLSLLKASDDVTLSAIGDFRDDWLSGGINTYEAAWLQGKMDYKQGDKPDGIKTSYGKLGLGYSRLQNLVSGRLLLYARYRGQVSGTSLDATERMAVGGPTGVRAFSPGEATADDAHVVTAELRFLPPQDWFGDLSRELVFRGFYDWGHAKFSHDAANQPAGVPNTATLSGWGIGATWERAGNFSLRLDLAWRGAGDALAEASRQEPRANPAPSKSF